MERATPISQLSTDPQQENSSVLVSELLKEMDKTQQVQPQYQPQQNNEEESYSEEEMDAYMEQNASMAKQFMIKESIVLILLFVLLQYYPLVDWLQTFLMCCLSKVSINSTMILSIVDVVLRGILLAAGFILVREFVL